jgi:hypothetical protein
MFKKPASVSGFKWDEHQGCLLMVYPKRIDEDVKTGVGIKDVTVGDIHVLTGHEAGKVYRDTGIFPLVVQGQLRPYIGSGDPVLGRVGKGVAKKGQSAPWVLEEATEDDEELAAQYLNEGAIGKGELGETTDGDDAPLSDDEDEGPGW